MIDQWYQQYSAELTGFIRSKGFTPEDAEDLCSQVFCEAIWRQPADIAPRAWLYRVAQSRMIDRHRQTTRRPVAPLEEWIATPEQPLLETLDRRALLLLTPAQQRVIEARFLHDRDIADVAADLGMSVTAIKALQHRGIERLKQIAVRPTPPSHALTPERIWTPDDEARVRLGIAHGWSDATIGRWLGRTATAVHVRANRLGISYLQPTTASAAEVARALGVKCNKTVIRWAQLGWLPVERSSTMPGAKWRFLWADVWAFCEDLQYWMAWRPERLTDPARRTWAMELRKGQPQWLTPGQVAQRCNVARNVVNAWIGQFGLKATRYGNWWINERDLEGWVPPGELPRAPRKRGVRHKRPRLPKEARQIVRGPHTPPPMPKRVHSKKRGRPRINHRCGALGCTRAARVHQLCLKHYQQQRAAERRAQEHV